MNGVMNVPHDWFFAVISRTQAALHCVPVHVEAQRTHRAPTATWLLCSEKAEEDSAAGRGLVGRNFPTRSAGHRAFWLDLIGVERRLSSPPDPAS